MVVTFNFNKNNVSASTQNALYTKILLLKGQKGDTGYSGDYNELVNRPSLNNVVIAGSKGLSDYGIYVPSFSDENDDGNIVITLEG